MDKCREAFEQIPEVAERIKRSKMKYNREHDFFHAPEWDSQSCSDQDFVNNFRKGWQSRQAEVDQLEEWNSNQAQSIKSYQEEDEATKKLLQKLIDDEYTTMRPSMAYEIQKVLRGEHE
ncbi:hypothetical protein [Acinetobacter bereziniae]|uniref:hypothetical protein n=1 Tax=Acinetobacter bereziniae TaxID=106648 RepID=UPI0012503A59|nr:hypothetical protein [Acinetobacter bereziniae]